MHIIGTDRESGGHFVAKGVNQKSDFAAKETWKWQLNMQKVKQKQKKKKVAQEAPDIWGPEWCQPGDT